MGKGIGRPGARELSELERVRLRHEAAARYQCNTCGETFADEHVCDGPSASTTNKGRTLGELMKEIVEAARPVVDELDDAECRELLAYTLAGAMVGTGRTALQTLEHLRGLLP